MRNTIVIVVMILCSQNTFAVHNANMFGQIGNITIYDYTDAIYIRLKVHPTSHPSCNPAYFVIDGSTPLGRRQMLLSRLLTAYVSNEDVYIGYDNSGNCAEGYIRAHSVTGG